jgi:hypothetical protein
MKPPIEPSIPAGGGKERADKLDIDANNVEIANKQHIIINNATVELHGGTVIISGEQNNTAELGGHSPLPVGQV